MHARCNDKKNNRYYRYGARGIYVCDRWKTFSNFLEDMGEPLDGQQIDRINNNGPYERHNCRWVYPKESARNKSSNRSFHFFGKIRTLKEISEMSGINYKSLHNRLVCSKNKWTIDDATKFKPKRGNNQKLRGFGFEKRTKTKSGKP